MFQISIMGVKSALWFLKKSASIIDGFLPDNTSQNTHENLFLRFSCCGHIGRYIGGIEEEKQKYT